MNLNKKVFWDPNAEENHTLQRLIEKERVEAGFFPSRWALYTGDTATTSQPTKTVWMAAFESLSLMDPCNLLLQASSQIWICLDSAKRNVLSGKCLTLVEIALSWIWQSAFVFFFPHYPGQGTRQKANTFRVFL